MHQQYNVHPDTSTTFGSAHEILEHIASVSNQGSDKPANLHSLVSAFLAYINKI